MTPREGIAAWLAAHGLEMGEWVDVPQGAKDLGCRNCRCGDRARHPELGLVYCAACPVTRRQEEHRAGA